jgi:hypothetical protein
MRENNYNTLLFHYTFSKKSHATNFSRPYTSILVYWYNDFLFKAGRTKKSKNHYQINYDVFFLNANWNTELVS